MATKAMMAMAAMTFVALIRVITGQFYRVRAHKATKLCEGGRQKRENKRYMHLLCKEKRRIVASASQWFELFLFRLGLWFGFGQGFWLATEAEGDRNVDQGKAHGELLFVISAFVNEDRP